MASQADPVVREIDIAAAPRTVFEFFVDPAKLTRWLATEAILDPRAGGLCVQVHPGGDDRPGTRYHMNGQFLEVEPPTRVVFSWGFTEPEVGVPPGSSIVEVTLQPNGSGTRVQLVHRGLPPAEVASHDAGWAGMLERLAAAVVEGSEGQVIRHEVWIDTDPGTVFAALTTHEGLDAWWGAAVAAEPEVGSVVEFDHGLGAPLRMRVTGLVPGEWVDWACLAEFSDPGNPASEWGGTRLTFELGTEKRAALGPLLAAVVRGDEFTVLRFRHAGWAPGARWFGFCNTAWGVTLATRLKAYCEG